MSAILCSSCGKELEDDNINFCISCGGLFCSDEFDNNSELCQECVKNGCTSLF
ncbi:hypothetical protein OXPF_09780 [Oxobacter pfennigii]|uniref:Uncharacterized protein n=1 Tax=Oxobacter pfennigii TaxID=36849 RepID=A0A0N8NTT7_9CLOT|nr:zinc-ribbon domain-containing protein [Oxobacter pfennigii]KPU45744.1 hypothetical protein OXPF_09780 [Oxobacter pfennigii]